MMLEVRGAAVGRTWFRTQGLGKLFALSILLAVPAVVHAQTLIPEDEYRKLIRVSEDIQPLGDSPFGERINLYDGSLSFEQADISVPGTGPTILIGRTFTLRGINDRPDMQNRAFGDWDMDLPAITTTTANQRNVTGWAVDGTSPGAICTRFNAPPSVAKVPGNNSTADWEADTWWQGYQMRIPGQGTQDLLHRSAVNTATPGVFGVAYPIVTKQGWGVGCPGAAQNDATIEGFVAVSPDGTKYFLNHLTYRYMPSLTRPLGSSPLNLSMRTDSVLSPMAANEDILQRREGRMLVTRIEDRFGNSVSYTYGSNDPANQLADKVTDITASDGRHVTIAYGADGIRVSSITVQGGAAGSRTWQYSYLSPSTDVLVYRLGTVTQPDGSAWTYDLAEFSHAFVNMRNAGGSCDVLGDPGNVGIPYTARMTHPSGLSGSFTVTPVKRGRSYVPQLCDAGPGVPIVPTLSGTWPDVPDASYSMAIVGKQLSGAGIGSQTWQYSYSSSNDSWTKNCATETSCADTVWTKVMYPDGHAERSTFSNRYDFSESLLKTEEVFDGDVGTHRRQLTTYDYVNPTGSDSRHGAYPTPWANSFSWRVNAQQLENQVPMASRVTQIDDGSSPDTYNWKALAFDGFARPTDVQRYSSAGYAVEEKTAYQDDYAHWVLGLPLQTTNVTTGDQVSRNVYDPNSLTLSERYSFGRKVMGYTFNAQGQLASFTDGNNKTTTLGSYKRGIPQIVGYPDGTSQSLAVDDLGQIASITNQAHATTTYAYDTIGRLASITYPAGLNPKIFGYGYVAGAERGVAANHWRRSVTQGSKVQMTYFDAMLRPIITDTYRSDGAFYTSMSNGYDWKGRKTFQSIPYDGGPAIGNMLYGTTYTYDVLGRLTRALEHTKYDDLLTKTDYSSGVAKTVTDPRGNATTSRYQAFDQPSYNAVMEVSAPESVVQTIERDVYGSPLSITQGGGPWPSIKKKMIYDSAHRLCRTYEPESGSEVMAYDGADNLAWSVSGASINGDGCGQDQVVESAKTIRSYDGMNRVTSVLYPTGTAPSTFTYDALGNPATATSGTVGWTFGHNALGQLTAEVLSVDGWVWGLGYGYDGNGALSTVRYPDEEIVAYNPDALGRPSTVGGYASGVSYWTDGTIASYHIGNGSDYLATENTRNLLETFTYGKSGIQNLMEDFTYDANGNVTEIMDLLGGQRTKDMSYDGLNRLTSAAAEHLWVNESYTYDTLNNIRTLTNSSGTNTYNYVDGTNRLNSITNGGALVHTFQYDDRGNTTNKDGQTLDFDLANRLTSFNGIANYTYDAAGRRLKKVAQGTTYYAYNSAGQLMWEVDLNTRLGSDYIYLGKKLIAKSTENIDILKQDQVQTALTIVGIPQLSLDGATIDVTLDIANNGSRPLLAHSQYPVQMGYHLVDDTSDPVQPEAAVNLPSDIPVGGHSTITMHVAAPAVLGTGKRIRFSLLQAGVAWFQDWPGNTTVDAGPYSVCPTAGTGNLCNNVTGLTKEQVNVALTITSEPTLTADGQNVLTTVDIANHGTVTLATSGPHPVQLGNHLVAPDGTLYLNDVARAPIPEIAPGQHAAVEISTPASLLLGSGRRVQFELVQEGLRWFRDFGIAPVPKGPYATLSGATGSANGSYGLSWVPIAGATVYNLQEQVNNNGTWTTVQSSAVTSWSTSGRPTGTYSYRLQACAANGCVAYGPGWVVNVLLPPPVPASISATAPIPGPIAVTWAASATATSYVVNQQFNGGAWTTYYNSTGTSTVLSPAATGTYVYQVQACNSSGCSGFRQSNPVSITRPPASAPGIAGGGAVHTGAFTISWSGVAGSTSYNLVESVNGGAWVQRQNTAALSWSTSGRGDGTLAYQVQGCNAGGCGPWSAQAVVTSTNLPAVPSAHVDMVFTSGNKFASYTMYWSAAAYATSYQIIRYPDQQIIYNTNGSSFWLEKDPQPYDAQYTYAIRSCNAVGCSAWSGRM